MYLKTKLELLVILTLRKDRPRNALADKHNNTEEVFLFFRYNSLNIVDRVKQIRWDVVLLYCYLSNGVKK